VREGRFDPHGLTDDEMLAGFQDLRSDEFVFSVYRRHVSEEMTFSAEALQQMNGQMFMWLGGRLMAYWKRTGKPPQSMSIYARIGFDGEDPWQGGDDGSALAEDA